MIRILCHFQNMTLATDNRQTHQEYLQANKMLDLNTFRRNKKVIQRNSIFLTYSPARRLSILSLTLILLRMHGI